MKKKVLFFHPHTSIGGTEQNIIKISKGLKRKGHSVHFCAFIETGRLYEKLKPFADSLTFLQDYRKSPLRCYQNYKRLIQEIKPDVVLNFGLRVELFSRVFSKKLGIDLLISNIRSTDVWRKWYHTRLDKLTQGSVDFWISNSFAGKRAFVQREGIVRSKIKVIYNFINIPKSTLDAKYETSCIRIGVLANIRPAKGHDSLIPLAIHLKELNIPFKIILAGKDLMEGSLFREIETNQLSGFFEYRGFIKNASEFFKEVDISLLPSKWEGLPTSILEAMVNKTPVIASNVGGIPEIITDGENGLLIETGNVKAMTLAVKKMREPRFREKLAEKGLETVKQKFSEETILLQWEEAIATLF